jgi:hypothetical protein
MSGCVTMVRVLTGLVVSLRDDLSDCKGGERRCDSKCLDFFVAEVTFLVAPTQNVYLRLPYLRLPFLNVG